MVHKLLKKKTQKSKIALRKMLEHDTGWCKKSSFVPRPKFAF